MFFGTIFGVLIIPGLYFAFAKLVEGRDLIRDEAHSSLSEEYMEAHSQASLLKKLTKLDVLLKARNRKNNKNDN